MKKNLILVVIALFAGAYAHSQQSTIQLGGPETLTLFGQKINEFYQHKHHGITIRTQGGSTKGAVAQLLKGQIDIAQSQGEIHFEGARDLIAIPVGVETMVVYVHEANPIREMSLAQLRAIYTGEILSWKQLGGPDQRIVVFGGEGTASLTSYFADFILQGDNSFGYQGKASTKDLLDAVASHPDAIGFAGLGSVPHVKPVRIRSGAQAADPTIANIRSLQYPIARYVYWYMAREPQGALKDFSEWMFSAEGQLVVEGAGFQPLLPEKRMFVRQQLGLPAISSQVSHVGQ